MLPGIRILFALVVLSFAILVFGFGALALLRSAHQHLASQPAWQQDWRTPVEIANARRDDSQSAAGETLALLRVDPPTAKPDTAPAPPQAQNAQDEQPLVDAAADASAPSSPVTIASASDNAKPEISSVPSDTTAPGVKMADQATTPAPPTDDPGKAAISSERIKVADLPNPANDQVASPAIGPDTSTVPVKTSGGDVPHDAEMPGPGPAKSDPSVKLAALPDTIAASNETRQQARQQSAKQSDAAELRAKRRARARLRARRLAQARARAARLVQTQQTTNSSYYNSSFTTTGSGMTSTTTNATPFGAPRGP
jgi:hypothetical protein